MIEKLYKSGILDKSGKASCLKVVAATLHNGAAQKLYRDHT